jgi:hypothetical protein
MLPELKRKSKRKWENNIKLKPKQVKTPTPKSREICKKFEKDSFYSAQGSAAGNEGFIKIGEFATCMSNDFKKAFAMKPQCTFDCPG